jgi:hypothetical protein
VNYWLDLFTPKTWQEFLDSGAEITGFRETRWSTVQKIAKGDCMLCYLTGVSRFVGVLEVTGKPFKDTKKIWSDEEFPCRIKVKHVSTLTPETGVPVKQLAGKLSFLPEDTIGLAWTGHFRGSPTKWKPDDGAAVTDAIKAAVLNPVILPIDPAKLQYRPKTLKAKIGHVTIPGLDNGDEPEVVPPKQEGEHTEIQWLLLKLGADMGFDVWVAKNDRGRTCKQQKFALLPRMKEELPLQFDDATNSTIGLIDVLWLKGNAIVAAFEIESTTSIYSGLLRMAELIAMQPNINIPLYLVAPEDRRPKVITEVNRPTFSRLSPPLAGISPYISFNALRERIGHVASIVKYLKPEFLEELSESCELDD